MTSNYLRLAAQLSMLILSFLFGAFNAFALKDIAHSYSYPSGSAIASLVLGFGTSAFVLYILSQENNVSKKEGIKKCKA